MPCPDRGGGGGALLEARVVSVDEANNSSTDVIGWLRYQPDADAPCVELITLEFGDGKLHLQPNSTRAVDLRVYDDDALGAVYAGLIALEEWNVLTGNAGGGAALEAYMMDVVKGDGVARNALKAKLGAVQADNISVAGRTRDKSVSLATGSSQVGRYMLAVLVQDDPVYKAGGEVWSVYTKQAVVQDQNEPSIIIEEPTENTFPALTNGTFEIKGYALDNGGANAIAMAFIPSALGQGALEDVKNALKDGGNAPQGVNVKIWPTVSGNGIDWPIGGVVYKKYEFSFECDVFNDFKDCNGDLENEGKLFVLYAKDDSHDVFETFKLLAYKTPPVVVSSLSQIRQHESNKDLTISFTATSDVGIQECKLEDVTDLSGNPIFTTSDGSGTYSVVIPSSRFAGLHDENKTFRITAVDGLGNKAAPQYSLFISDIPMLEDITSDSADGTYKIGDTIRFTALFTESVSVTGTPKLRLYADASCSGTPFEAKYEQGGGSVSLTFAYTVKENDEAAKLFTAGAGVSPIDVNGGAITAASGESAVLDKGRALQSARSIAVDGVKPSVTVITTASRHYKEGETVNFIVSFSEKVLVSGSPLLMLNDITGGSGSYKADYYRPAAGNGQQFSYVVKSGDTSSSVNGAYFLPADMNLITDEAGNPLALGGAAANVTGAAVIDTTPPDPPVLYIADASGGGETLLAADGFYNAAKRLVIKSAESGVTMKYSLDGEVSWTPGAYVDLPAPTSGETVYQVTAKAIDLAGNESNLTDTRNITIRNNLSVLAVTSKTPDGNYSSGKTVTFTVSLSDAVGVDDQNKVSITVEGTKADDTSSLSTAVSLPSHSSRQSALSFDYVVPLQSSRAVMRDIRVTQIDMSGVTTATETRDRDPPLREAGASARGL
jgi:hypothetical protein